MKVWYNKINESRRSVVEVADAEVTIGRDPDNAVCAASPLVSRRHAVVRASDGKLYLENVGLNSCIVGDEEVLGGQTAVFEPGTKVRIWPFTLTFEAEKAAPSPARSWKATSARSWPTWNCASTASCWSGSTCTSSRPIAPATPQSILLLENNIEDVCRDMQAFAAENEALLEEITGPDAPRPSGQPTDYGDGRRGIVRLGVAHQQRVRRAGHAGSRARGRAARRCCSLSASG